MKLIKKRKTRRPSLTYSLAFIVYGTFLFVFALSALALFIFRKLDIVSLDNTYTMFYLVAFIVIVGFLFSLLISRLALIPINKLMNKINDLANGDFASRYSDDDAFNKIPAFRELTKAFNKLAFELQNTEMLRHDFINNFSHEFKTPIASITGFAKLLKRANLTAEERLLYLDAIEEESLRLSYMATNVLNLTKVENQAILSEVSCFNVSEQIRSSVLLLEPEWTKKELEFSLNFDEITINANEELLKQVFINLIDNAIKFSNQGGTIDINASLEKDNFCFSIKNYGCEIPAKSIKKIFNKFYQVDTSHSTKGNGIGLAIVKRIVELHGGEVDVLSENNSVCFTIRIPNN